MNTPIKTAADILARKRQSGVDAYLWVHTSGDVILWPDEASSENDSGARAVARWTVDEAVVDALIDSGECDELA